MPNEIWFSKALLYCNKLPPGSIGRLQLIPPWAYAAWERIKIKNDIMVIR